MPRILARARIDRELGARIRQRRIALGLSQTQLGATLGVAFQQLQKYESGKNRVSVSALVTLAAALHAKPCELLDGLGAAEAGE